jgi:hypothetical protein
MRIFLHVFLLIFLIMTPFQFGFAQESEDASSDVAEETEEEKPKIPGQGSDTFIQIQPEKIHMTFVDFYEHEPLKAVQDRMYSIPGVTDFIPYLATKGLITYDVRYSGHAKLLFKALRDTIGRDYELGMKEIDTKQWEITIRQQ